MDVIGKILPTYGSTKHAWILVATNYFTKWVKTKFYVKLTVKEVYDLLSKIL